MKRKGCDLLVEKDVADNEILYKGEKIFEER